jgi:hypothetical protein
MELDLGKVNFEQAGANVLAGTVGDNLVIVVNTTKNLGPSSTGKMYAVGNTGGFTALPGGLKANVYVGKPAH